MKTSRKALRDLGWSAVSTGANAAAAAALMLFVGNWLESRDFGGYSLATTIYILASTLAAFGVHVSALVYGARHARDRGTFDRVVTASLGLVLALGLVSGVVLWLGAGLGASLLRADTLRTTLPVVALALPLLLVNKVLFGLLNSVRRMRAFALCTVARHGSLVALTVLALLTGRGLLGATLAFPAAEVLTLVLLLLASRGLFTIVPAGVREWWRRVLWLGLRSLLATLVSQLSVRVDILVVAYFTSEALVGTYSIAAFLAGAPALLLGAFQRLTTPIMSIYHAAGHTSRMGELGAFLAKGATLLTSVFAVLLSLLYPELIVLLYPHKPELVAVADPFRVLLLGQVVAAAVVPCGTLFTSAERPGLGALTTVAGLAATLGFSIVLIPRYGLLGAALAAALGRAASAASFLALASWALQVELWARGLLVLWAVGCGAVALGFVPLSFPWRVVLAVSGALATVGVGLAAGALRRHWVPDASPAPADPR